MLFPHLLMPLINGAPDNVTVIIADLAASTPAESAIEFFGTAAS